MDTLQKEIVWVFGTSASGKETFMRNISQNPDLQGVFGWEGESLVVCEDSIKYIGRSPIVESREGIIDQATSLLKEADVVLIKWQLVDSLASRLTRLRDRVPDARHRIIRLDASRDEMIKRLQQKAWWYDYGKEEAFIDLEIKSVEESIDNLDGSFAITKVSSGATDNYAVKS